MLKSVLIANRGEIAVRIARACTDLGIRSTTVFAEDDVTSKHSSYGDVAIPLRGVGPDAYLDMEQIIAAAKRADCDAIHPGYGFLSESDVFARKCASSNLIFIGPPPEALALFGNKTRARALAEKCGIPVPRGSSHPVSLEEARQVFDEIGESRSLMIKAVVGGGGRGMRVVRRSRDLAKLYKECRAESRAAFRSEDVYVEEFIERARHIEIQILGDKNGSVVHLHDRECSIQRRHQKLVEIAPSPTLTVAQRNRLAAGAKKLARAAKYCGLGTVEFLVSADDPDSFFFIEANPRLQVEHTVTEEVLNIDLVQIQLRIAGGDTIDVLKLQQRNIGTTLGSAIQVRIYAEQANLDGSVSATSGKIRAYEMPSGPGIRVDGFVYPGYEPNLKYDPLLAKLIVHSPNGYEAALRHARIALEEFHINGVQTNRELMLSVLCHPDVVENDVTTSWFDEQLVTLLRDASSRQSANKLTPVATGYADPTQDVGSVVGIAVRSPSAGVLVSVDVSVGDIVLAGQSLATVEAMKMQSIITAEVSGEISTVVLKIGGSVREGSAILFIIPDDVGGEVLDGRKVVSLDRISVDLGEVTTRRAIVMDSARGAAVAKRHAKGGRTARENVDDLCDAGSFAEYGAFAVAAQKMRRSHEELLTKTPADGVIVGTATVNAQLFGSARASVVVVAIDYTVLAGTLGFMNRKKQDRMYRLAAKLATPVILFAEGGGGRPSDTDHRLVSAVGMDSTVFRSLASLSALVPLIGIVHGHCFAANAALLACCDVIVATRSSSIGLGGPAMVEGAGLGVFPPEAIGPSNIQSRNGVIDVLVEDEAEAVSIAKKYLSYFQGRLPEWKCEDQRKLRHIVPENRVHAYSMREVIRIMADTDSVLELRASYAPAMITALVRVEGQSIGVIANNPAHLGGALDAEASNKMARFIELCDAYDLPIVALCDTPGFMVGPDAESSALVRHVGRMFVGAANLTTAYIAIFLRKGYGLAAQAMAAGSFHAPFFTAAWPTGEFGAMNLEGAVRLSDGKALDAISDENAREAEIQARVKSSYDRGKAISVAESFEIDDVIDPATTRNWICQVLRSLPPVEAKKLKKRAHIELW